MFQHQRTGTHILPEIGGIAHTRGAVFQKLVVERVLDRDPDAGKVFTVGRRYQLVQPLQRAEVAIEDAGWNKPNLRD